MWCSIAATALDCGEYANRLQERTRLTLAHRLRTTYGVTVSTNNSSRWITAFALVIIALEINKRVDNIGDDVFFWIAVVVGALIVIVD